MDVQPAKGNFPFVTVTVRQSQPLAYKLVLSRIFYFKLGTKNKGYELIVTVWYWRILTYKYVMSLEYQSICDVKDDVEHHNNGLEKSQFTIRIVIKYSKL